MFAPLSMAGAMANPQGAAPGAATLNWAASVRINPLATPVVDRPHLRRHRRLTEAQGLGIA